MKQMVNAFAEYAAAPKLDLATVDINQLLAEVALLYEDESVELVLDLEQSLPTLSLDAPRIRQLVHNLIRNSLEAQHDQQHCYVQLQTRLLESSSSSQLELVATDRGPGFSTELIGRLFEPYITSKSKGTGLGLAIVKKIVEEHGGTVVAENIHDAADNSGDATSSGACIRVRLPILSNAINLGVDAA